MNILGVNVGMTREHGFILKDGGACLLRDGHLVVGVPEERLTRRKHEGGFANAVEYCLAAADLSLTDVDMVVVSNCSEAPLTDGCDIGLDIEPARIRAVPSHHLSHAFSTFLTSPFERAVIMVIDNEGNLLGKPIGDYWNSRFERNSYYLGEDNRIVPLVDADDGLDVCEIGPGEVYRHFTYFLGWPSYVYAGKTMGLASYGQPGPFDSLEVMRFHNGGIRSLLANGHSDPVRTIRQLARDQEIDLGAPRQPDEPITQRHCDIARVVQSQLEKMLVKKARQLYDLTGVPNLCLAGGVALNCVATRQILDQTPFRQIYVPPAPGDTGQCIGNALYGWNTLASGSRRSVSFHTQLGRTYSEHDIDAALIRRGDEIRWIRYSDVAGRAAQMLAHGQVLGWFQGASEIGPRALGARCVVADPRHPKMRDYLNLVVKGRESFRPYAPSVLAEHTYEYFDLDFEVPYMEMVGVVRPEKRDLVPAITHVDGTARLQTVTGENGPYADLIRAFYRLTGTPLILNTSFNLGGEPIVESPADAVECFMRARLDALVIHNRIVWKTGTSETALIDQVDVSR